MDCTKSIYPLGLPLVATSCLPSYNPASLDNDKVEENNVETMGNLTMEIDNCINILII